MWPVIRRHLTLLALFGSTFPANDVRAQRPSVANSADGVPIHYEVHGSDGPTLVLVHGWASNRTFWEPHTRNLARSHRVAVLDLAGFGASGTRRTAWTMERFGQDVAAVLRLLPSDSVVLVGHAMGGAAVLEAARIVPDKVVGVILVDAFHDPTAAVEENATPSLRESIEAAWHDPVVMRQGIFTEQAPDSLVSRFIASTPATPPEYWWESLRNFSRWQNSQLVSRLSALSVPLAAINKETPPTNVAAFNEHVAEFSVFVIERVGHLGVVWERPIIFERQLLDAVQGFLE